MTKSQIARHESVYWSLGLGISLALGHWTLGTHAHADLPRIPPTPPDRAEATFQALAGFRMELIAAEPMVTDPVAMAYDESGRAYVVEMNDYPYTDKSTDKPNVERTTDLPLGKVRLLEDTDDDGRFDKSTVFARELSWPTGVAIYDGGVFVAGTPDVWYLKDTDGDGVADVRKKVFSGFRKFNVQALVNNLAWGPDHRIYGAGSSNGGEIVSHLVPDSRPVVLGRNDFSFDPRCPEFTIESGSARFGNCFDDWGNRFICNIRNPIQHVVLPHRYLLRNPYLPVVSPLNDVAEAGDQIPVYRASPPEPWRVVNAERLAAQGDLRTPRSESNAVGYMTSACGLTIYRGDAYPAEFRQQAFLCDVAGNLIHRQQFTPNGVTFKSRRIDEQTEFVRSTDNWCRPVNFAHAPDGTLHVLDMYRETIEHPWSMPDDLKAQLDLESGRDRGRIYRLAPPGFERRKTPKLGQLSTAELVALLDHPNAWHRDTAHRLILERQDTAAVESLQKLLREAKTPQGALLTLWSLKSLNKITDVDLLAAVSHRDPAIRAAVVHLAESRIDHPDAHGLRRAIVQRAADTDVRVRFQTAFTLGAMRDPMAHDALSKIARHDAADPWVTVAVLSSSGDAAGGLLSELLEDLAFVGNPARHDFLRQLATVVGGRNHAAELARLGSELQRLLLGSETASAQRQIVIGLAAGLRRSRKTINQVWPAGTGGNHVFTALITDARRVIQQPDSDIPARLDALQMLALGRFGDVVAHVQRLLEPRQPQEVQLAAIRTLAGFDSQQVPTILLAAWPQFTPPVQNEIVEALLARADRIPALLDAVEKGDVKPGQISPLRRTLLMSNKDAAIASRAKQLFAGESTSERKSVIQSYGTALQTAGTVDNGRKVFQRECIACHRLEDKGHDVGPSLTTIRHRRADELLTAILDPNREIGPNFMQYVVQLDDGRISTGMIAAESATSITLKRAENQQETFLRANIEAITNSGISLMPEGVEKKISPAEMADLLAYLRGG